MLMRSLRIIVVLSILFVVSCVPAHASEMKVVTGSGVRERVGPGTDYEVVDELNLGDEVSVEGYEGNWAHLSNGYYVCADYLDNDIMDSKKDEYDSIVYIDLSDQWVEMYVKGNPVGSGPCVTGDLYSSPTPTGEYVVYQKFTNGMLMGSYPVDYFVAFNGNIGMHDAYWRDEFGGDIYTWGGSHGCVNLPHDLAEIIYNNSIVGSTVVVVKE